MFIREFDRCFLDFFNHKCTFTGVLVVNFNAFFLKIYRQFLCFKFFIWPEVLGNSFYRQIFCFKVYSWVRLNGQVGRSSLGQKFPNLFYHPICLNALTVLLFLQYLKVYKFFPFFFQLYHENQAFWFDNLYSHFSLKR